MPIINCRCGKPIKAEMEVEYSAWINEFFCSSSCATDKYFEYMGSTPVDPGNTIPSGASFDENGFLVDNFEKEEDRQPSPTPEANQ